MSGRDLGKLGCALLLGAAIAFPAGLMLAGGGERPRAPTAPHISATARAVYSPKLLSDPYFLDQQRTGVEALETHCRNTGEMCAEAQAARRWLAENGG